MLLDAYFLMQTDLELAKKRPLTHVSSDPLIGAELLTFGVSVLHIQSSMSSS